MKWIKPLLLSVWLLLFTAYIAERSFSPVMVPDLNQPVSTEEPVSYFDQSGPCNDAFILPANSLVIAQAPVVREPFFKWKSFLLERSVNTLSCIPVHPELVQDTCRCPSVAIVLFPYHEFL